MALMSSGLLMYKKEKGEVFIFLVHPGGPFFKNKDKGWWTIPKGLPTSGEELLETAAREFREETGIKPSPPYLELGQIKQKGGKVVHCWAFEGSWEKKEGITCNTFPLEWPPRSGKEVFFPEIDKAEWMGFEEALLFINRQQRPFLERLKNLIN